MKFDLTVLESIDAKLSGSGDINIIGKPKNQKTKISGSGDIDFR